MVPSTKTWLVCHLGQWLLAGSSTQKTIPWYRSADPTLTDSAPTPGNSGLSIWSLSTCTVTNSIDVGTVTCCSTLCAVSVLLLLSKTCLPPITSGTFVHALPAFFFMSPLHGHDKFCQAVTVRIWHARAPASSICLACINWFLHRNMALMARVTKHGSVDDTVI